MQNKFCVNLVQGFLKYIFYTNIGFILNTPENVDHWYQFLEYHNVKIRTPPKTHRDGARSFYCYDPANTVVQMIYHPPIV